MDQMEEGEIPSSENEEESRQPSLPPSNMAEIPFGDDILDDSNYVIIERPKSSLPLPSKSSASASPSKSSRPQRQGQPSSHSQQANFDMFSNAGNMNSMDYSQFGKGAYYNKAGVSDLFESSDKESSSSSDSDDDFINKRSRMAMPTGNWDQPPQGFNGATTAFGGGQLTASSSMPNLQAMNGISSQPGLNEFFAQAAKFQKERKPNLVWANVMEEEELSKGLGNQVRVGGGLAEVRVTRGPETYFFQRPTRQPRQRRASDSSDISSEGLSDNALHYLKDGICDDDEETEESSEHSLPKAFTSSSSGGRKNNKRRKSNHKHKRKIINKLRKMKAQKLAEYMGKKLKEEKTGLLTRAINLLGKDSCIRVFLKTLKIEKRGGVMTKSQERRRTPGGVFLYLIRGDKRFPKSLIDTLFHEDRAISDRKKKIASKSKRPRKKDELESAKAAMEQGDMKCGDDDLSESQSDCTTVPEVDKEQQEDLDGTDTGHFGDDSTQESSVHSRDIEEFNGVMGMQCEGSGS